MKTQRLLIGALLVIATSIPVLAGNAAESGSTVSLSVGQAKFWDGGYVPSALTTELPDSVACGHTKCFTWHIKIPGQGYRLRAAMETPSREDTFTIELADPSGAIIDSRSDSTVFDEEVFAHKPVAGTWSVTVIPRDASYATFKMRAKLEATPAKVASKTLLLPNLQATPPYEFGFVAPANPANGLYPPDTVNPPLDVLGYAPVSCTADETVNITNAAVGTEHPSRCLRFTTGPRNNGPGPFEVHYNTHDLTNTFGVLMSGPATQYIYRADGTHITQPAGVFQFHVQHGHYHYNDILNYQLYKVTDTRKGTLVASGHGVKSGFCPADELFSDWQNFTNDEGHYINANCGYTESSDGAIGQSAGWGDVYRWQRPGQFVDWGTNTDGLYVVRTVVDILNHVKETNELDNSAYAYLRVVGEKVTVLERGQGLSPWDPTKKIFTDQ